MDEVLNQNIPPRPNKNKHNKVIIFSIIGLIIIIGAIIGFLKYKQIQEEKAKEEYATLLATTSVEMFGEFLISSMVVSSYSDIWRGAIDLRIDFNKALSGHKENISKEGILEGLEDGQNKLRDNMKLLQNPPDDYMESYIVLKQMYGTYTKMSEQALSPSGSLIEFNRKTNDLYSEFEKQQEEFLITIPTDVKKLKEKIEKDQEEELKDETDKL